jgi:GTP pyrophosphokinase
VAVKFSHCCNPVPGDDIIGFVTRGRGVTIHRTDCINILNLNEMERHRLIEAEWDKDAQSLPNVSYTTELKLICDDRVGLVMDVSRVLSDENMLVKNFSARSLKDGTAIVEVMIDIKSKDQLEKIVMKFKNIKGVDEIQRVSG